MSRNVLLFVPRFGSGGAEAFVVNVAEGLVSDGYEVNILSIDGSMSPYDVRLAEREIRRETLLEVDIPNPAVRYLRAYSAFADYLKSSPTRFDVLHVNAAQGEELPFLSIAKGAGIPVRVLHSHSSFVNSRLKHLGHVLCKSAYRNVATDYLACSDKAAQWLLPRDAIAKGDYRLVNNGIDTRRFAFDPLSREETRRSLGLEGRRVYLHVARLTPQKNQAFLMEAFRLIRDADASAILLMAGEGELESEIKGLAFDLGLRQEIRWLGNRQDVPELLCAADAFLLPSLYEGFPFSLVEAQASGLPCLASDRVSSQCDITGLCSFSPLDARAYACAAEEIAHREVKREAYAGVVAEHGFDLCTTIALLEEIYGGDSK